MHSLTENSVLQPDLPSCTPYNFGSSVGDECDVCHWSDVTAARSQVLALLHTLKIAQSLTWCKNANLVDFIWFIRTSNDDHTTFDI